jgi:hypothetical protein
MNQEKLAEQRQFLPAIAAPATAPRFRRTISMRFRGQINKSQQLA